MSFRYRLVSSIILLCTSLVSPHPPAELRTGSTISYHGPSFDPKPPPSPSASVSNPALHEITCFLPATGRVPTTLSGCMLSLEALSRFPNYRQIQQFLEYRYPEKPYPPPFVIQEPGSTCAIRIAVAHSDIVDYFSFSQVRRLVTDILAVCRGTEGFGGWAPVGNGIGWTVAVGGVGEGGVRSGVWSGSSRGNESGNGHEVSVV